ncbi:hypothetical protein HK104_001651 [Borealophlyctis nickersoniae]|nr:hypothetical protein HK104_001651 [Borealophlyctis nickersoniae]
MRTSVIDEPAASKPGVSHFNADCSLRKVVFGKGWLFDLETWEKVVNYEAVVERGGSRKVHGVAGERENETGWEHQEADVSRKMTARYMQDMLDFADVDVVIVGARPAGELFCF